MLIDLVMKAETTPKLNTMICNASAVSSQR